MVIFGTFCRECAVTVETTSAQNVALTGFPGLYSELRVSHLDLLLHWSRLQRANAKQ